MSWRAALTRGLGGGAREVVVSTTPLAGGDINEAYAVTLASGRELFVKTRRAPPAGMYEAEAAGLEWLRAGASGLAIPEVVAVGAEYLALELWPPPKEAPGAAYDEALGRGLAALHASLSVGALVESPAESPMQFGLDTDNYIADLPQPNPPSPDWVTFYRDRRLRPFVQAAAATLGNATLRDFERLYARLPELVGDPEPPARLHGDLWGGNQLPGPSGRPGLIDPAAYAGHREVDLAMMRLFGGFSARVFAAYQEASPLQPGHDERVPLYQLYPLLVHVRLFGGGYVGSVRRALARLL